MSQLIFFAKSDLLQTIWVNIKRRLFQIVERIKKEPEFLIALYVINNNVEHLYLICKICKHQEEELEGIIGVIRIRKSKKDGKHNGQKKKNILSM
jgi:hypothetical protein